MKVVSVNVGSPQPVEFNGRIYLTGIFKKPVTGRIPIKQFNLQGDKQADLTVHGGVSKAVYAYPLDHYPFWRETYPGMVLEPGMFGENLTIDGLDESTLCIGDRLRVGTAELVVTEPRMPCIKLGIRFGRMDIVKHFTDARKPGVYFSVDVEGDVAAGDVVEIIERDPHKVAVTDIVRVHLEDKDDYETMARALKVPALPEQWREEFTERLSARP